ncbi:E3 SUMO-protein ligase ZBED1-like [Episyrphus balteatus]|uniref:E3 SUMO-protein ligase ZBED1-like n=1 Tax=Episyrphus balteatus TaxID=286459 RepID=UPI002485C5B9|nr:E3 SUMO-protein ligase ZBED1-like [Episyrphus balteatus]
MSSELSKKRSAVWMHFSLLDDNKAKCCYCQKPISFNGFATGNLKRHLKSVHVGVNVDNARYLPQSNTSLPIPSNTTSPQTPTTPSHINSDSRNFPVQVPRSANKTSSDPPTSILRHFSTPSTSTNIPKTPSTNNMTSNSTHLNTPSTSTSSRLISDLIEIDAAPTAAINSAITSTPTSTFTAPAPRQQEITSFMRRPISVSLTKQLDEQLTKTIVKQYYPFSMVEDTEFKEFVRMLCPTYQMPSRKTVSNSLIPRMFSETKAKVQEMLASVESVCVTTDGWTSMTQQSYIGMTVHFIQEGLESLVLRSNLLGCIPYDQSHTSRNLGNLLKSELQAWGLESKVTCVVTDNAANIVGAVKANNWSHFPCFAHTLNLVLGEGITILDPQLVKIKSIVAFFKRSSRATVKLTSMQKELNLPELKLKNSCATRWNSTYDMLVRIVKVKSAVVAVLAIENPELNCVSTSEWKMLEKAAKVFQIFQAITEEISAEKNVTISKVMLMVSAIKNHLSKLSVENHSSSEFDPAIDHIIGVLSTSLNTRFKFLDFSVDEKLAQATLLDPRFKKFGFANVSTYKRCLKELKSKALPLQNSTLTPVAEESNASNQASGTTASRERNSLIWEDFDSRVDYIIANPNQLAATIMEVDKYINEPLIRRNEDPLKWWSDRKHIYPRLYRLVLRRLCIVATSVPCERVFSKAGLTIESRRSSLKPAKAAQSIVSSKL